MSEDQSVAGSCECKNISFIWHITRPFNELKPRLCQCDFCTSRSLSYYSQRPSRLEICVEEPENINFSTNGTNTARFWHCSSCSMMTLVTCAIQETLYAVVAKPAMHLQNPNPAIPVDFSAETTESRLDRRENHWIDQVVIPESMRERLC